MVLPVGPKWAGVGAGETEWIPGTLYNGVNFRRYRMWNGTNWQYTSLGITPRQFPTGSVILETGTSAGGATGAPSSYTLPSFPVGITSALAIVSSIEHTTISTPSGWTLLRHNGINQMYYSVFKIDQVVGTESLTVDFSGSSGSSYTQKTSVTAYFTGGTPGVWSIVDVNEHSAQSLVTFTDIPQIPQQPVPWMQFGVMSGIYTPGSGAPAGVSWDSNGLVGGFAYPSNGTRTGSTFITDHLERAPLTSASVIDYDGIGAYGTPNSASIGLVLNML